MARKDGRRENQHYVPKMILRNFAVEPAKRESERVWVFDKSNSSCFCTNIRNIAAESEFYDTASDRDQHSMEEILSSLEKHAARALTRVVDERSLARLSVEDRRCLAVFCAVQFVRTLRLRELSAMMDGAIQKKIIESGGDVHKVKGYHPLNADEAKGFAVSFISVAAEEFAPHFEQKTCFLLETIWTNPFFIGDNPVALYNQKDVRPYGNLGLAVPGIEIYFPLTPRLTIAFWDPNLADHLMVDLERAKAVRSHSLQNSANATSRTDIEEAERLLDAARTGGVAACKDEVVMFLNSLQVIHASRFVMSATADFALAMRMLSERPRLRFPQILETN
jgi:hypothetical protein